jgi:NADPH:quinone reductase-like Zn-dependent oxidoreductase
MRAVLCNRYGPPEVLELTDIALPVPGADEVLIRILVATVTAGYWRTLSLEVPPGFGLIARLTLGLFRPRHRIPGTELAGDVEAVGSNVTRFKVGDPVFAFDFLGMGCYAEYKRLPEDGTLALNPRTSVTRRPRRCRLAGSQR